MIITLCRKPIMSTTVKNVEENQCGGINIDVSRIGNELRYNGAAAHNRLYNSTYQVQEHYSGSSCVGRFPANVLLSTSSVSVLDKQSGILNPQAKSKSDNKSGWQDSYVGGKEISPVERVLYLDTGGASRFFKVVRDA